MGILERAIRRGVSRGVGDAIGKAVRQAAAPKAAEQIDKASQGAVCPSCGRQNAVGTKFCQDCGTKLPAAAAEEKAAKAQDAADLRIKPD